MEGDVFCHISDTLVVKLYLEWTYHDRLFLRNEQRIMYHILTIILPQKAMLSGHFKRQRQFPEDNFFRDTPYNYMTMFL